MQLDTQCPYCGEPVDLWVDESAGSNQAYVEDCSVCCRPWAVTVSVDDEGEASVAIRRLDE